ncbi:MAG: M15 family metallopeptidase [Erysipelotrichaceae bacterium]|nr:M15 family metallopeptidase [Erysipelotrichaceae bacterium]
MRKISFILLILILLCACAKTTDQVLEEMGYSLDEIDLIMTLSEENQNRFLDTYDEKLLGIVTNPSFKEENLDTYLKYYGEMDDELIFDFVNRDIINDNNHLQLKEIYESPYYVSGNEDLYFQYLGEYDDIRTMMEIVNTKRYLPLYENVEVSDTSYDYLLLVNKYYQLPSDYEPDDLVDIEGARHTVQIRSVVKDAFEELNKSANEAGYNLVIYSAYRSYAYQEGLYNKYLLTDSMENVDTYSARPGHSEHQSGLCLDVSLPGVDIDNFYMTEASKWLAENCYDYGFIIRYEEGKEDITGYQAEPWQIRYVGKDASKKIQEMGITFDEYWECFVRND